MERCCPAADLSIGRCVVSQLSPLAAPTTDISHTRTPTIKALLHREVETPFVCFRKSVAWRTNYPAAASAAAATGGAGAVQCDANGR